MLGPRGTSLPQRLAALLVIAAFAASCAPSPAEPDGPPPAIPAVDISALDPLVGQAVESSLDALRAAPDAASAWRTLALTADANAIFPLARTAYEAWLERDAKNARGWAHLARVRHELGDVAGAHAALERSIELDASHAPNHARLGGWKLDDGNFDAAAESYRRAIGADATLAAGHVGLARVALQSGDLDAAGDTLTQYLAARPSDLHATWLLGTLRRRQGRPDEAAALLARGVGADPLWHDAWEDEVTQHVAGYHAIMERAIALGQQGRGAEAAPALELLAAVRPDDLAVLEKLVAAYLDAGKPERALRRLDEAESVFPEHPRLDFLRGLAFEKAGDIASARNATARSVERSAWPPALALLARCQWRLNDVPSAAASLAQLIALDPDDIAARIKLARAYALIERPADAAAVLDAALARFPQSSELLAQRAGHAMDVGDRELAWTMIGRALAQPERGASVDRTLATLRARDPEGAPIAPDANSPPQDSLR